MADSLICPRTYDDFYRIMKQTNLYTDADILMLYNANKELQSETNHVGGTKYIQAECLTLHTIYKYSLYTLLCMSGIYCGYNYYATYQTIMKFVEMCKTAFNEEQFKHLWDVVGKAQLGLGFMERLTKHLVDLVKNKDGAANTMTWVKNIFEIFCKVDNGEKVDNIEQKMKNIITEEIQKNPPPIPPPIPPSMLTNENIVYNGKIINIQIGDVIITISPKNNIPKQKINKPKIDGGNPRTKQKYKKHTKKYKKHTKKYKK